MTSMQRAPRRTVATDEPPIYEKTTGLLRRFLREYEVEEEEEVVDNALGVKRGEKSGELSAAGATQDYPPLHALTRRICKYPALVSIVVRGASKVIDVLVDDVARWVNVESARPEWLQLDLEIRAEALELAEKIETNTLRYMGLLEEVLDELVKEEEAKRQAARNQLDTGALSNMNQEMDRLTQNATLYDENAERVRVMSTGEGGAADATQREEGATKMRSVQAKLRRKYELHIIPSTASSSNPLPLRMVRAHHVGKLVTVQGIVTRVTEVKPMLIVATYTCDTCSNVAYQLVTDKTFMPIKNCGSSECAKSPRAGKMRFHTRGSKFLKFQQIKLQELSSQVPIGHIPRTLSVHVMGELTRKTLPGDVITVNAIFLPVANQGFSAIRFGLVAETFMLSQSIEHHKKRYVNVRSQEGEGVSPSVVGENASFSLENPSSPTNNNNNNSAEFEQDPSLSSSIPSSISASSNHPHSMISKEMTRRIESFISENDSSSRYSKLAKSIAPEIFGHEDVKKALLLQMVGGVTRVMEDGMRNRGDINICLMGDPGVAKSQLLKHIQTIAPRAVYTSGKGSTGVGLTAAILRDPVTKEFVLEGGSLTIADMGICCIDEFDKMEDADRTAIHEVMEQQTISIAKAGITTTLNARTAVLAAANPAWGRYNPKRSPTENINLPASLLSRFDLLFLILDRPDSAKDRQLAQHITFVHRNGKHPPLGFEPLDPNMIRAYISIAKLFTPHVPNDLMEYIVSAYCSLREDQSDGGRGAYSSSASGGAGGYGSAFGPSTSGNAGFSSHTSFNNTNNMNSDFGYTSARSLLAILRLSQALARLRFSLSISKADIDEAIRLMNKSKATLFEQSSGGAGGASSSSKPLDVTSAVYGIIRDFAQQRNTSEVKIDDVEAAVLNKGFTRAHLEKVLDAYDKLGVWSVSANRQLIKFI